MVIVILVILIVIGAIILGSEHDLVQRHKAASKGVVNHDAAMRTFCYRVESSEYEVRDRLRQNNIYTSTKYRYDDAQAVITFYSELPDGSVDTSYRIRFWERENFTYLQVTQVNHFWEKQRFAILMNEFWHQKLDAEPFPYIETFR